MLKTAEHEIFVSNKYKNANNSWRFNIMFSKEFAIVSNLRFIRKTNFVLPSATSEDSDARSLIRVFADRVCISSSLFEIKDTGTLFTISICIR